MILAAHDDGVVRVWEVFSGKILHEFSGHVDSLWSATASSEYSFVSCGKDKFVRIWDLYEDRLVLTFEDHAQSVRAAVVSPNGRLLVSGDDNGEVFFRLLPPGFIKSREDVKELRRQEEAEKAEKKRQDGILSMLENLFSADHEGNNVEEVFYAISQAVSAGDVVHVWRGTPFTAKWLIKQEWVPSEIKSQIENLIKNILKNEEDSRLRRKCYLTGYALYSVFVCFLLMCVTSFAPVFVLIAFVIGFLLTWIFFLFLSHEMNVIERRLFLLIPTAFLFFILLIKTSLVVVTFSTLTASIFALVSCHFVSERIINTKGFSA